MTEDNEDEPRIEIESEDERPVSYSAFTSWLKCGKAYELERIIGVPPDPKWYFVGGNAVHATTELYDKARWEAGLG